MLGRATPHAQTTFFAVSIDFRSIETARARASAVCGLVAKNINRKRRKSRLSGAPGETYDASMCRADR
jgi:hypothetical protein